VNVRPGLRERKKAKTREAIQRHALRLFREQGWEATTIEQIADAAEVSPSTFFRYFPSKEDVVLYDAFDPLLFDAIRAQPKNTPPIKAVRNVIRDVFDKMPADVMAAEQEREELVRSVPELRARMLESFTASLKGLIDITAERTGKPAGDADVAAFAGLVFGCAMTAWVKAGEGAISPPGSTHLHGAMPRYIRIFDELLAVFERGVPFGGGGGGGASR
jgi:AcrR family transcriptional regulator